MQYLCLNKLKSANQYSIYLHDFYTGYTASETTSISHPIWTVWNSLQCLAILPTCVIKYSKCVCSGICVVSMVCSDWVNGSTYAFFQIFGWSRSYFWVFSSFAIFNSHFSVTTRGEDLLLGAYLYKSTELWWPKNENSSF
jgi:hypothetical protein